MDELKMSLDEIAEQHRKNRQSRGRARAYRGRFSRGSQRGRYNSYSVGHSTYRQRRYTNKQSQRGIRKPLSSTGRRLLLTNLNKELTNDKLKQLFEPYGKLTRCGVHFDKMGDSKGTADIEYATHEEAEKAIKEMNKADINGVTVDVKYKPRRRLSSMRTNRRNSGRTANVTLRRTKIRRQIARRRNVSSHSRGAGRRRALGNDDNRRRRRIRMSSGNTKYRRFKNSLGIRRRRN